MKPPITRPSLEGLSIRMLRNLAAARCIETEGLTREEVIIALLQMKALERAV